MLHCVPCGCGLGERHSNAFVTQEGGNCRSFLHNCAFVPLPGGYQANIKSNKTSTIQPESWISKKQHNLKAGRGGAFVKLKPREFPESKHCVLQLL